MRILLDTHVFIWAVTDSEKLGPGAREMIVGAKVVYVSVASIWEIAIKARIGKIETDPSQMVRAIGDSGFVELPVTAVHAAQVAKLPHHHNDPFDHLLVAQAMLEPLVLMTADAKLERYSELVRRI